MLIDINAGMAEHEYRRQRLSELYPKQRDRRSGHHTRPNRRDAGNQIVVKVRNAVAG
jgi:hypothetical protein